MSNIASTESLLISFFVVAIVAIGMALSFFAADPSSPSSRALAMALGLIGTDMLLIVPLQAGILDNDRVVWTYIFSMLEAGIIVTTFEWIIRIVLTETPANSRTATGALLRAAQSLGALYGLVGIMLPQYRLSVWQEGAFQKPIFYAFALPFFLALTLALVALIQLFRSEIERAERVRLRALGAAAPFLAATTLVPLSWKPAAIAIGETIFLSGAIRYHVLQGRRGEFLARFLSPQLARLVREKGLADTMGQSRAQLSIVACDLRGFTAFSETAAPEDVIEFLREYYATVGQAVSDLGGSILNFAGDGIISLVGAPIPLTDYAQTAVRIALQIRTCFRETLGHWQRLGLHLGLGIGVASGFVTVGTIASSEHLEYTAVGPAVNLAARLSSHAESGQVLVDHRTAGLVSENNGICAFENRGSTELKGFARPIALFSVAER
jgi:adenylate cyclase